MATQTPSDRTAPSRQPFLTQACYKREATVTFTAANREQVRTVTSMTTLGSSAHAPISVADPAISKLHLEMEAREEGLWIRDLGSTNGTYVDAMRIGSAWIPDGGRFRAGNTVFRAKLAISSDETYLYPRAKYGGLLGSSEAMRDLFTVLGKLALITGNVSIHGETGTGKELIARVLHEQSPRAKGPFVVVDFAALSENLVESELYGHTRGAFTGATTDRIGAFAAAHGGTIFLDEIGELPLAMQMKLLRVLESRTVRRLGENDHREYDFRVVCATHRDLRQMVNDRTFREDLYFRLAVLCVEVPPLRDRREDIMMLVRHFLPEELRGMPIDPSDEAAITARPWRGNARELRNFVEQMVALGMQFALGKSEEPTRTAARIATPAPSGSIPKPFLVGKYADARRALLDCHARQYLEDLHERHNGDKKKMMAEAGMGPTNLWRLSGR